MKLRPTHFSGPRSEPYGGLDVAPRLVNCGTLSHRSTRARKVRWRRDAKRNAMGYEMIAVWKLGVAIHVEGSLDAPASSCRPQLIGVLCWGRLRDSRPPKRSARSRFICPENVASFALMVSPRLSWIT